MKIEIQPFKHIKEGMKVKDLPQGTICGYCPRHIFEHNEVGGRLHFVNGKPACAVCRIKNGKKWEEISADKTKYDAQLKSREDEEQAKADAIVREVSIATVEATNTGIIKNK